MELFTPRIEHRFTFPMPLYHTISHQLLQRVLNGYLSDCRNQLHDITLGELANLLTDYSSKQLNGRELLVGQIHTILKVPVGCQDDARQVLRIIATIVQSVAGHIVHLIIPLAPWSSRFCSLG